MNKYNILIYQKLICFLNMLDFQIFNNLGENCSG